MEAKKGVFQSRPTQKIAHFLLQNGLKKQILGYKQFFCVKPPSLGGQLEAAQPYVLHVLQGKEAIMSVSGPHPTKPHP